MGTKKQADLTEPTTKFQPGRYVLISEAADLIRVSARTIWGWREEVKWSADKASLFVKPGKAVLFDLDAWARYLERLQQEGVEAAKAWNNRFRAVALLQTATAAAIITALLHGGGGF